VRAPVHEEHASAAEVGERPLGPVEVGRGDGVDLLTQHQTGQRGGHRDVRLVELVDVGQRQRDAFEQLVCAEGPSELEHVGRDLIPVDAERVGEVVDQLAERGLAVEEAEDQGRGGVEDHHLRGAAEHELLVADAGDLEAGDRARDEGEVDVVGRQRLGRGRLGRSCQCRTRRVTGTGSGCRSWHEPRRCSPSRCRSTDRR